MRVSFSRKSVHFAFCVFWYQSLTLVPQNFWEVLWERMGACDPQSLALLPRDFVAKHEASTGFRGVGFFVAESESV